MGAAATTNALVDGLRDLSHLRPDALCGVKRQHAVRHQLLECLEAAKLLGDDLRRSV
jgi:hypothetical protein